ncbi:MAG: RNA 2',3'-cyclic phosphodiesterase [Bacteroidales bacterium]|nr:RNA 2',3'-cyclic phosphodiesterase [Bacteroidales bacterium]
MKRTFLAVDIHPGEHFRKDIEAIRNALPDGHIKWVDTDRLHLTIRFFGDTEENDIALISDAVFKAVAEVRPFRLRLSSLGVFRSLRQPRVIWIGCDHPEGLTDVKKKIDDELEQQGFPRDNQAFSPHLTLGRIRSLSSKRKLAGLLEHYREHMFYEQHIPRIVLYESILRKNGPEYLTIQAYDLEG